jgi:biopolymer transport protein ExbD
MDLGGRPGGRSKSLDAALNLVPFIDLMAVTIVFLIMSAVWTQLGRVSVGSAGSTPAPEATVDQPPPPRLVLTEASVTVFAGSSAQAVIPLERSDGRLTLGRLRDELHRLKVAAPDETRLTLESEDGVAYGDLVRVLDECLGAQFPTVSVSPASL